MIKLASLFDGIGGGPLCAVLCGAEPVWASEIDEFPIKVTKIRFPNMKHYGDITKINGAEVEPVDIIVGGSPCQDLSVAGKRAGMKHSDFGDEYGTRSGLFMEQIRIVKEMRNGTNGTQPRFMVWENVPGAFSSKGSGDSLKEGEAFRIVLEETARIADPTISIPRSPTGWSNSGSVLGDGFSISWRTLDAQYWGVPQRRRRIYLIADFGGESAPEILFESEGVSWYFEKSDGKGQRTAGEIEDCVRAAGFIGGNSADAGTIGHQEEQAPTVKTNANHIVCFEPGAITREMGERSWDELCPTLRAEMGDNQPAICIQGSMIGRKDKNGPQGDGINEDVSFTLNATDRHAVVYGICSDNSNSMKSDNPYSGIYEADTARTIDANGGNPACNQGGMLIFEPRSQDGVPRVSESGVCPTINTAQGGQRQPCVVEPAYTMLMREGKEGGGKGPLIQTDKASTLMVGGQQTLFEPISLETYHCENHEGTASVLKARDWKDPQCVMEGRDVSGVDCRNFTETEELFGTLQAKENGGQSLNYSGALRSESTVRRLTPLECERLQGYPDGWTDIPGASDLARYKALGNSFAIPNALFVISGCIEKVRGI